MTFHLYKCSCVLDTCVCMATSAPSKCMRDKKQEKDAWGFVKVSEKKIEVDGKK